MPKRLSRPAPLSVEDQSARSVRQRQLFSIETTGPQATFGGRSLAWIPPFSLADLRSQSRCGNSPPPYREAGRGFAPK